VSGLRKISAEFRKFGGLMRQRTGATRLINLKSDMRGDHRKTLSLAISLAKHLLACADRDFEVSRHDAWYISKQKTVADPLRSNVCRVSPCRSPEAIPADVGPEFSVGNPGIFFDQALDMRCEANLILTTAAIF
jgi:hypothetical protein